MYYTYQEKQTLKLIVKTLNVSFVDAFHCSQYLPEDTKELIHRRFRDEIIY
jgi:hypothetical protein